MTQKQIFTVALVALVAYLLYRLTARTSIEHFAATSGNVVTIQNKQTNGFLSSCENCPYGLEFGADATGAASRWIVSVALDGTYTFINDKNRQTLSYNDGMLSFSPIDNTVVPTKFAITSATAGGAVHIAPSTLPHLCFTIKNWDAPVPYFFKLNSTGLDDYSQWIVNVVQH